MIARALQGEEADDHEEQNEMHGRRQETARDKEVVGEVDQDISQGEIAGPAVGDDKVEMGYKLVSAEQERKTDENDGGKVELSGGGEGGEAADFSCFRNPLVKTYCMLDLRVFEVCPSVTV